MEALYASLTLSAVIISSLLISRVLKPSGAVESMLFCFTAFTGQVIATGYLLSSISSLDKLSCWSILSLSGLSVILAIILSNRELRRICFQGIRMPNISALRNWYSQLSLFEKTLLVPPLATIALLGLVNLAVVLFSAPHNDDSMTFHLPRVAFYIQHGNLNYYHASYWCQVVHPKNSTLLMIYTYLVTGRNENMMQLVQFISYWIAIFSVYGISRRIGNNVVSSLLSSSVFALLVDCLMQSVTTQNDMLITAYIAAVAYLFFAFRETRERKYLFLAGVNMGLVIGVKASALLAFPSLLALGIYALHARPWTSIGPMFHNLAILVVSTLLAILVFALPSGYVKNYTLFGHPIFPESVRSTVSFEGESVGYIMKNGSKNALRYAFEFFSFDGMLPVEGIREAQVYVRSFPAAAIRSLGIDLETTEAVRGRFHYDKAPVSHEDFSYWGVLGFGLIWIIVLLSAVGIIKSPAGRALSIAAILYLLVESYSGFYDPWRGRRFMIAAIFATPVIGCCLTSRQSKVIYTYFVFIVFLGCLSAWTAVLFRVNGAVLRVPYKTDPLIEKSKESIFSMDRLGQLTRNKPRYYAPLRKYEKLVPKDAVVAICLPAGSYEYPLFGKGLTRTIISLYSYFDGFRPIPQDAQYLLYARAYYVHERTDIYLGERWYLRDMGAYKNAPEAAMSSRMLQAPRQIGFFRDGIWHLDTNGNRKWDDGDVRFNFGSAEDMPVVGDWDGNGIDSIGIFREGVWNLDTNDNHAWEDSDVSFGFGLPEGTPVVGDWNGDGIDEVGVFQNSIWYLDMNGDHAWDDSDSTFRFGTTGDTPLVGDWNDDGIDEVGVFQNSIYYLDIDGDNGWDDGDSAFGFGLPEDTPVAGDWNGDGTDEVGVFRNGIWYLDMTGNHAWDSGDMSFSFGMAGDVPVLGNW